MISSEQWRWLWRLCVRCEVTSYVYTVTRWPIDDGSCMKSACIFIYFFILILPSYIFDNQTIRPPQRFHTRPTFPNKGL